MKEDSIISMKVWPATTDKLATVIREIQILIYFQQLDQTKFMRELDAIDQLSCRIVDTAFAMAEVDPHFMKSKEPMFVQVSVKIVNEVLTIMKELYSDEATLLADFLNNALISSASK